MAPASHCSLRSVEGGLEEVREVFSGRCRRSTSSINSSLLRRSSSPRPIPPLNQQKRPTSRAWVITSHDSEVPLGRDCERKAPCLFFQAIDAGLGRIRSLRGGHSSGVE